MKNECPECIEIDVTAEDIAAGVESDCYYCPIALAAGRAFRKVQTVTKLAVGAMDIVVSSGGDDVPNEHYSLPLSAQTFIRDFDGVTGKQVKPFKFHAHFEGRVGGKDADEHII